MKALFAAAAKPRLSLEAINWAWGAKSETQSNEPSFEPLSITRIFTPVVVAITDSMHAFSKSPEFQLMIATVLRMFSREHQHDIQRIHSERQAGNTARPRHPGHVSGKPIHHEIQACVLTDAQHLAGLEPVLCQQSRDRFGIEEKIMLWNKLPPPRFEDFKRQRVDVRCLDDKQTARPHPLSCSANEASRRIHMLDDMKTCDDIEIRPRQTLNDVLMYWNDRARRGRQFGIRLHAVRIEPFSRGSQKISSRAAGLEQFS